MDCYDAIIRDRADVAPALAVPVIAQVNGRWLWEDGTPRDQCPSDRILAAIAKAYPTGPLLVDAEPLLSRSAELFALLTKLQAGRDAGSHLVVYVAGGADWGRVPNLATMLEQLPQLLASSRAIAKLPFAVTVAVEIHAEHDTTLDAYLGRMTRRLALCKSAYQSRMMALVRPDRHPSGELLPLDWLLAQRDLAVAYCESWGVWGYRQEGSIPGGDWEVVLGRSPVGRG